MACYAIIQKYVDALNQAFGQKYSIGKSDSGYYLLYAGEALSKPFTHKYEFEKSGYFRLQLIQSGISGIARYHKR